MLSIGSSNQNLKRLSPPKTEPLPQRNGLFQHGRTRSETRHERLSCFRAGLYKLPRSTDSVKNAQQKLARRQNSSLVLRVQLVGEQIPVVVRPHW